MRWNLAFIGLAVVLTWISLAAAEPVDRSERRTAAQALSIHYRDRDIYFPVSCDAEEGGKPERTWVLCRPSGREVTGGLFTVDVRDGLLHIWAVNGRAKQHIAGADFVHDINQDEYPIGDWSGDPLDISAALSLF